jgi:hypothetical protein
MQVTPQQRTLIAARAAQCTRTIDRIYAGKNTYASTRARVVAAARELGLPLPPEPVAHHAP